MNSGMMNNRTMKRSINHSKGLGLVELMIAVSLGLLIMAGVIQLYASSVASTALAQGASRIQENMRYAFKRIGDDVAMAGNYKCPGADVDDSGLQGGIPIVDADGDPVLDINGDATFDNTWRDFSGSYISGNQGAGADPIAGSDTLMLKYIDAASAQRLPVANIVGSTVTIPDIINLNDLDVVAVGDCKKMVFFTLTLAVNQATSNGIGDINNGAQAVFFYAGSTGAYHYFIDTSAVGGDCDAANPINCSLYRQQNNQAPEELVRGVHRMEVTYSNDTNGVVTSSRAVAVIGRLNIDRVTVSLTFNDTSTSGQPITRTVSRLFSVTNNWSG